VWVYVGVWVQALHRHPDCPHFLCTVQPWLQHLGGGPPRMQLSQRLSAGASPGRTLLAWWLWNPCAPSPTNKTRYAYVCAWWVWVWLWLWVREHACARLTLLKWWLRSPCAPSPTSKTRYTCLCECGCACECMRVCVPYPAQVVAVKPLCTATNKQDKVRMRMHVWVWVDVRVYACVNACVLMRVHVYHIQTFYFMAGDLHAGGVRVRV